MILKLEHDANSRVYYNIIKYAQIDLEFGRENKIEYYDLETYGIITRGSWKRIGTCLKN